METNHGAQIIPLARLTWLGYAMVAKNKTASAPKIKEESSDTPPSGGHFCFRNPRFRKNSFNASDKNNI